MSRNLVVHCKKSPYDIYIGRPSIWGNPFEIGKDGSREEVIEKHRLWLPTQSQLIKRLHELEDRVLGCWCYPKKCHGNTLVELTQFLKSNGIDELIHFLKSEEKKNDSH